MAQNKAEEARAKLEDVLRNVPLSFTERAAIAAPLADMALQRGNYLEARRLALIATMSPFRRSGDAWTTRIKADLTLGDISDALYSFAAEQANVGKFAPDSIQTRTMEEARATANAQPQLKMLAEIPATEDGDAYTFVPYRRAFTFQALQGSLQKFILSCRQATMEADITPTAKWRIPNNWSGCSVYVRGAPRTQFLIVQLKD